MKDFAPKTISVPNAINDVMRRDRGRILAGLISRLGDFQLAEDALQDALISALLHWERSGIPHAPTAWLMKVALNKSIDRIRSKNRDAQKSQNLSLITKDYDEMLVTEDIPDERLRLIFACCHPALEEKSRIALTLRTVCNLTTREIAASFLDTEVAMGQRLSRAKSKIKNKGIGFSVPNPEHWPERLNAVLVTLYLIYTAGYVTDDTGPRDLCEEGLFLARMLCQLRPADPEIEGLLALMLLTKARASARIAPNGANISIAEQDHTLWQHNLIVEAQKLLAQAIQKRKPGPFQIKAAIADCHMEEPRPDWTQMLLLYQSLWRFEPTPVIALNWAVVLAETGQTEQALQKLNNLKEALSDFQPWHAASASILHKLNRPKEAAIAYRIAIKKSPNEASRVFLEEKLCQLINEAGRAESNET